MGTQYRSGIYCTTPEQERVARHVIAELQAEDVFDAPIVTEVQPLHNYWPAEDYHQDILCPQPHPGLPSGGGRTQGGQVAPRVCPMGAGLSVHVIICGFAAFRWPGVVSRVSQALRKTAVHTRVCGASLHPQPEGKTMVVIRLSRGGSKARPFYNIVVANKQSRRDGRFIERIGFYNPLARGGEEPLRMAQDRLAYWQGVGAQASEAVERLIKQAAKATRYPAA